MLSCSYSYTGHLHRPSGCLIISRLQHIHQLLDERKILIMQQDERIEFCLHNDIGVNLYRNLKCSQLQTFIAVISHFKIILHN